MVNTEKISWKSNLIHNLPLNKILKHRTLTMVVRSVFEQDGQPYPQNFLDECLYEL